MKQADTEYDLTRLDVIADSLDSFEKDCTITVALKIVDDTCKMNAYEKSVFMALYDTLAHNSTNFFKEDVFEIIELTKKNPNAQLYAKIKELREAAMEMISRPKMKAFKASVRKKLLE